MTEVQWIKQLEKENAEYLIPHDRAAFLGMGADPAVGGRGMSLTIPGARLRLISVRYSRNNPDVDPTAHHGRVTYYEPEVDSHTRSDGSFRLSPVCAGEKWLVVANESTGSLARSALEFTVVIRVRGEAGPIALSRVTTDARGEYAIWGYERGRYRFEATPPRPCAPVKDESSQRVDTMPFRRDFQFDIAPLPPPRGSISARIHYLRILIRTRNSGRPSASCCFAIRLAGTTSRGALAGSPLATTGR